MATVRTNLVTNPSFEVNTTGWILRAGSSMTRTTSVFDIGAAAVSVTSSGSFSAIQTPTGTAGIPVSPSTRYTLSASYRAATIARSVRLRIYYYNSAGTQLSSNFGTVTDVESVSVWNRGSYSEISPSTAAYASVEILFNLTVSGEVHYADAVLFEQTATATAESYFDGSFTDTSQWDYAWTGTAHASTSSATSLLREGSGAGSFDFSGSTAGKRPASGISTGSYDFSGSTTTGKLTPKASATGGFTWSGSGTGKRSPKSSGTGTYLWAGSATGKKALRGTAAGAYTWAGSASGTKPLRGGASGAYAWAGSAVGYTPFGAPSGLTATAISATQINLSWNAVNGADGYDIERDGVIVATEYVGTNYSDTGLSASTEYDYRVRAVST